MRSSNVSIVYVVRLRAVFSKAALQKRGSIEPMEPPLDPALPVLNTPEPSLHLVPFGQLLRYIKAQLVFDQNMCHLCDAVSLNMKVSYRVLV